jgi:hypothetical protein
MKFVAGLVLAAGACFFLSLRALAMDPPEGEVRLFYITSNDVLATYADFNSLDRSGGEVIHGWTYNVYTPPKSFNGIDAPVGSYWEEFDADCGTVSVISYGIVGLTEADAVIIDAPLDHPHVRDAAPGSFDGAVVKAICAGTDPGDGVPFKSAGEAEAAAHTAADLDNLFGLDGSSD